MHALITGGTKGIGLAIARELLVHALDPIALTICARNADEVANAERDLKLDFPGSAILGLVCDVSSKEQVDSMVMAARTAHGPIELLVNNAGFGRFGKAHEMTAETFSEVLATNLRGVFLCTKAVLEDLRSTKGTVVTISSIAGKQGYAGGAAYCASKFGVRGLMQSLFLDVRDDGVRVITVFPGTVKTDFFATAGVPGSRYEWGLTAESVARVAVGAIRLPNSATVSEIDLRPTSPK